MNQVMTCIDPLTAADLLTTCPVVIPRQTLVASAVRLLHDANVTEAPVVNEEGRCIGMLLPAGVLRWIQEGCPQTVVGPAHVCPYLVHGRLLTGGEGAICILADGSCPYQSMQPATGGRHIELCIRPATVDAPFAKPVCYATMDGVTINAQAPLLEVLQRMINSRIDHLVVVDEHERPKGTLSAKDVLSVVAKAGDLNEPDLGDHSNDG